MSLVNRALAEYKYVNERNKTVMVKCPPPPAPCPYKDFDFEKDEEFSAAPIHEIEIQRETHRRAAWGEGDIYSSHCDFAKAIDLDQEMAVDPETGFSLLDVCPGKRAYDGDPIEETYRALKYALGPVVASVDWMKQRELLGDAIATEYARMKWMQEEQWAIRQPDPEETEDTRQHSLSSSSLTRSSVDRSRSVVVHPTPFEVIFPNNNACKQIRPRTTTKQRFMSQYQYQKERDKTASELRAARRELGLE